MTAYRRHRVPGGTYFFSVHLQDSRRDTLVREIDLLRQSVRITRQRWPFVIDAAVVLPNQMHMIWTLPAGDADFSKRWRLIKSTFSRHLPMPPARSASQRKRGDKGVWQRRFWEHCIRNGPDLDLHMALIRDAPVTMGLTQQHGDWPYSSFAAIRQGRRMRLDASLLS